MSRSQQTTNDATSILYGETLPRAKRPLPPIQLSELSGLQQHMLRNLFIIETLGCTGLNPNADSWHPIDIATKPIKIDKYEYNNLLSNLETLQGQGLVESDGTESDDPKWRHNDPRWFLSKAGHEFAAKQMIELVDKRVIGAVSGAKQTRARSPQEQ